MSHYKRYPEYKASGVEWLGDIPVHWRTLRLRFLAEFNPSPNWQELERSGTEYPFLPMEAIGETGELDWTRRKPLEEAKSGYTFFSEGDVVYAKVTPCFENGKGAVIRGLESGHGFGTTELTVLRPKGISPEFLYAILHSYAFRNPAASSMTGAGGLKRVPDDFARGFVVALPSLSEQQKQASGLYRALKRIDALISKKTRFIELVREKRQAIIARAVTKGLDPSANMKESGSEWIGEIPTTWRVCNLAYVTKISTGGTPDRKIEQYWGGEIPWIKTGEVDYKLIMAADETITREGLENCSAYIAQPGTLLMAMYGMGITRGRVAILGIAAAFNQACAGIACSEVIVNRYLFYVLTASYAYIRDLGNEASQINLNMEIIGKLKIPVPPVSEQQQIIDQLDKSLSKLARLEEGVSRSIQLLQERRSALITAAVTGQIDLEGAA